MLKNTGIEVNAFMSYNSESPTEEYRQQLTHDTFQALRTKKVDILLHSMKELPFELPEGIVLAGALRREDPRDAMVTKSTYGALQELPQNATVGANSRRRVMQIKDLRPDIQIIKTEPDLHGRLKQLEENPELDAVLVSWAALKRLNISPRYYVALQPEQMLPAPCQGIVGILAREEDTDLIAKINYIEDSEASWASRCERAFLSKFGATADSPIGANAHRKGTQDPWILDTAIGDIQSGEVLRHREIGTSRCKPESLADKAYNGIMAKGARKFVPFN